MIMNTDLFTVKKLEVAPEGQFRYRVELNPDSVVYRAHFPQEPVTPGVCLLQMVSACLENALDRKVVLDSAKNVKFMTVVSPKEVSGFDMILLISGMDEAWCAVKASAVNGETVYMKASLRYSYV